MKKRQLKNLHKDEIEEIEQELVKKRKITVKNKSYMANKKILFKRDYTLTPKQKELVSLILDNDCKIVVIEGPPGAAKTFTSIYASLKLLENKDIDKIFLTKPIVQVGDALGFLPGTKEEKINPYLESFISNFETIIEPQSLSYLMDNVIEFKIAQYMRGANYKNMVLIVDEMQNFSIKELMTITTRLNSGSKIIFCGDTRQSDINKKFVAIDHFKNILGYGGSDVCNTVPHVKFFKFTNEDILRDPILSIIVDNYDNMQKFLPDSKNNS